MSNEVILTQLLNKINSYGYITSLTNSDGNIYIQNNGGGNYLINLFPKITTERLLNYDINNNVVVGTNNYISPTTISYDSVLLGQNILYDNGNLAYTIAIGDSVMNQNNLCVECVAIGHNAMSLNNSGARNVAIGADCLANGGNGSNNISVCNNSDLTTGVNNTISIGNDIKLSNNESGIIKFKNGVNTQTPLSNELWFGDADNGFMTIRADRIKLPNRTLRINNFTKTTTITCSYTSVVSDTLTTGGDIIYNSNTTTGDYIQIINPGVYAITALIYSSSYPTNDKNNLIDLNGTDTTNNIILSQLNGHEQNVNSVDTLTYTGYLNNNDIVRIKSNCVGTTNPNTYSLNIILISN